MVLYKTSEKLLGFCSKDSYIGYPYYKGSPLDMLRAADENKKLETALSSSVHQWLELLAAAGLVVDLAT